MKKEFLNFFKCKNKEFSFKITKILISHNPVLLNFNFLFLYKSGYSYKIVAVSLAVTAVKVTATTSVSVSVVQFKFITITKYREKYTDKNPVRLHLARSVFGGRSGWLILL